MNKEILRLAIPNIISNISVPLLSTVDVIFMGSLSAQHIGAVGIGSMIFSFLYWNFGFLRMGTTGMTAQSYGRGDARAISLTLYRALSLGIILAICLLLISPILFPLAAWLMNASEGQMQLLETYFYIGIAAAPATLLLFGLNGWFFGMQNAIIPLWLTILVNSINIALSYWMVMIKGWGIAGVAWGTVLAQYAGLLFALLFISIRYREHLTIWPWGQLIEKEALTGFFKINGDIFIRTLCLSLAFGFFYSRSAAYGELVLAANVILMQLLNWMSYGIDGFAYAAESLVGKYFGARNPEALRKAIRLSFLWGLRLALFYSLVYGGLPGFISNFFTKDAEVLATVQVFIPWMVALPIAGFASYIWDGIFVGMTATTAMRNTMFLSLIAFIVAYLTSSIYWASNHGLWLSLMVFLVARGILQWVWFKKLKTD